METLDILYILKKLYDKSHKAFWFFIKDNRYIKGTGSGMCYSLSYYCNELYLKSKKEIPFEDRQKALHFLYDCYLERGGKNYYDRHWFPTGELTERRKLINYAINKLKKQKVN